MTRVYTDERFPEFKVVNDGSLKFQVYYNGQLNQTFMSWPRSETGEKAPVSKMIDEPTARQRAQDWFDRLAAIQGEADLGLPPESAEDLDFGPAPEPGVTAQQIDDLMAQEKLEQDPTKKQALRQQIMQMMRHEESAATAVVNHLIG